MLTTVPAHSAPKPSVQRTGRLDDRGPARNLALDQRGERRLAAPGRVGDVAPELEQALAHAFVVERLVECVGELVEDRFWRCFGCEQRIPGRGLELRQPGLLRGRH